jgi:hypothetical protein
MSSYADSRDHVDADIIHECALETVLREPVQQEQLCEIPSDLRVSGLLLMSGALIAGTALLNSKQHL